MSLVCKAHLVKSLKSLVKKSEPVANEPAAAPGLKIKFFMHPSGEEPRESVWILEAKVGRRLKDVSDTEMVLIRFVAATLSS